MDLEKRHYIYRIIGKVLFLFGVIILIIGIIGIFVPLVPGAVLIVVGLTLMGEKRLHKKIMDWKR